MGKGVRRTQSLWSKPHTWLGARELCVGSEARPEKDCEPFETF